MIKEFTSKKSLGISSHGPNSEPFVDYRNRTGLLRNILLLPEYFFTFDILHTFVLNFPQNETKFKTVLGALELPSFETHLQICE